MENAKETNTLQKKYIQNQFRICNTLSKFVNKVTDVSVLRTLITSISRKVATEQPPLTTTTEGM